MSTTIPVTKQVLARGGTVGVWIYPEPQITDPDQVRLYRNRTRVLLRPEPHLGAFVAVLDAHDHDLFEASTADGSPVRMEIHAAP